MKTFLHRLFWRHNPLVKVGLLGMLASSLVATILVQNGEPVHSAKMQFAVILILIFGLATAFGILRSKNP